MKTDRVIKFNENTKLHIGDYFRAYRSKYCTLIKDIAENQRDYDHEYGECYVTMLKVDIYNKKGELLASNSIVPIDKLISGALAKYIPNLNYDPTYLGSIDPFNYPVEHKIWRDMIDRCFDFNNPEFIYIGALGTTVCDRWRCFEYFLADFKHIAGYAESNNAIYYKHYIVDLYDIQKRVHPSNRIYAPGYVKLKPFKESDICKYTNLPPIYNNYPKDIETTMKYKTGKLEVKNTLFDKQTGMNVIIDLDNASYYYNNQSTSVTMINPYQIDARELYMQPKPMREMCVIIRKE